jgi:hypothetical protein
LHLQVFTVMLTLKPRRAEEDKSETEGFYGRSVWKLVDMMTDEVAEERPRAAVVKVWLTELEREESSKAT